VRAVAVNFGELPNDKTRDGHIPGWEAAGVVEQVPDSDPSLAVGTRVVTWGLSGGWAERRVADIGETAVVPDRVDLAEAATLPVAALTAFRALRSAGSVLGRNVLVTGASGGVGGFGVQLAALGGAHVTAVASDPAQADSLHALGADEVVVSAAQATRTADVVLDNVGGPGLAEVIANLGMEAQVMLIGAASWQPTQLEPMALTMKKARLVGFQKGHLTSADLGTLLGLLAAGRLDTRIVWRGDWMRIDEVIDGYRRREIKGKAVLEVS
jgi:NADPH:quinone reductase